MLNNLLERTEAQDAGTIILTGFVPEIVLSSVRTVIEEFSQRHAEDPADLPAGALTKVGSRKENNSAKLSEKQNTARNKKNKHACCKQLAVTVSSK